MLATQFLEVLREQRAHRDDPLCHSLHFTKPLVVQLRILEDLLCDTSAVDRRVRVQWAYEDLDLGVDPLFLLRRLANNGEGTDTLTIEALKPSVSPDLGAVGMLAYHVLCKALCEAELVTLLNEMTKGECVPVDVTARKALVGHVEEGVMLALLDNVAYGTPLRWRRVDPSWVVSTRVEQNQTAFGKCLDIRDHSVKVEANRVLVVVPVLLDL